MRGWILEHFVAVVAALGLVAYVALRVGQVGGDPIRSDAYSYYVYLPSWFIHHDITLESVAADCCGGTYPTFTAIHRSPTTRRWVNAHPIGTALLMTPFFVVAHVLTRWSNLTPDGFSSYYQWLIGFAGFAYLLTGLAILRSLLRRHFDVGPTLAALTVITFGTNLLHYGLYDSAFSHAFSFFLLCALLALTDTWWSAPTWRVSVGLGAVAGLVVLTRHSNALYLAIVPLFGVAKWSDITRRVRMVWERRWQVVAAIAVGAAVVAPQIWLYVQATGRWGASPYGPFTAFTFTSPRVVDVLFSVQKGLLFWSPSLLFAAAGLVVAQGWSRGVRLAAALTFVTNLYLVSSWWDWQMGHSFGHRGFTDALGLAAIFLAAFFSFASHRRWLTAVVSVAAGAAVLLSLAQMAQYWLEILPPMDMSWEQYRELFLQFS